MVAAAKARELDSLTSRGEPASEQPPGVKAPAEAGLVACVQSVLGQDDWSSCATALVTQLSRLLKCQRVSLGWVSHGAMKVVALSDGVLLDEGAALPELHQAMLESAHQCSSLVWPPTAARQDRIMLVHQALFKTQGLSGLMTVPLARKGRVVGVLTCERVEHLDPLRPLLLDDSAPRGQFSLDDVKWLEALAETVTPALVMRHRLDLPRHERLRTAWFVLRQRLADPLERQLRLTLMALACVLFLGLIWPMPHQVNASARLEGAVQRVMGAPQDGYLREVHVRPGDIVKAGQVLAELSDDDLQNARRARVAEVTQHENAFGDAFARGDRAQAVIAQSKLSEARAQLALIEQQLQRLQITSPFDGVVIAGDLRQQLGAPVKRGDTLFTLAPGLDWRVVLDVDESDIASLQKGQQAALRLAALPDKRIGLLLDRVTPVAKTTPNGLRYEIEARPTGAGAGAPGLRPGLQGVAKIEMASQPLLWRAAVRGWQWVRMAAWTWL